MFFIVGSVIVMLLIVMVAWFFTSSFFEKRSRIQQAKVRAISKKKETVRHVELHIPLSNKTNLSKDKHHQSANVSKEQDDVMAKIFQDSNIFKR